MTDLDKLDALAAAATPDEGGHWYTEEFWSLFLGEDEEPAFELEDIRYLAACDPATIRDLVVAARERDELRTLIRDAIAEHVNGQTTGRDRPSSDRDCRPPPQGRGIR